MATNNNEEKLKALGAALNQIEKDFGKGSIMKLGEASKMTIDVVPTGSIGLDIAIGIGGMPKGRIIEVYGPESSGKTTVALHTVAEAQKQGGIAAFIDAEHALDPVYIVAKISFTPFMERINVWDVLRNTLTGDKGLGGIETKGVLRTGMPYKKNSPE